MFRPSVETTLIGHFIQYNDNFMALKVVVLTGLHCICNNKKRLLGVRDSTPYRILMIAVHQFKGVVTGFKRFLNSQNLYLV